MKRILFILGVLILIIAIATGIWFFFLRGGVGEQTDEDLFGDDIQFGTFFDNQGQVNNVFNGNYDDLAPEDFTRETRMPILRQLSAEPVAGFIFFKRGFEVINNEALFSEEDELSNATSTQSSPDQPTTVVEKFVFRFMERSNGHISETNEDTLTVEKITNTTIQKVNKAFFSGDGQNVLVAKLSEDGESIDSFLAEIIEENTTDDNENPVTTYRLANQPYSTISQSFTRSPNKNSFAYFNFSNDTSNIYLDNFSEPNRETVGNIVLQDIVLDWQNEDQISITTKASSGQNGFSYLMDVASGSISKILGEIEGLTVKLSPSGEKVLFSRSVNNAVQLSLKDLVSNDEKRLSVSTLPEKCVFSSVDESFVYCAAQNRSAQGQMPDDWYKGKILFDDIIWRINLENNFSELFYSFDSQKYGSFDMIDIEITDDDKYLVFKNKKDLTLWSLNIEELNNEAGFNIDSTENPEETPVDL